MVKRALITGVTGQDGSYLAELLLWKGYEVHGIIRKSSLFNTDRIDHIYSDSHESGSRLFLHYDDMTNFEQLPALIWQIKPDEIYNLAAQTHVKVSFELPEYTGNTTALGTTRILEAVRRSGVPSRFYQASSSEMFGNTPPPQNELSVFAPRSPYAAAKAYAYWMTVNYRDGYNIFASNGILFNHEGPRRGDTFVTKKISRAVARIKSGLQDKVYLGNLQARRDWGYAPEYVEAMWLMLQQDDPDNYVIGSGKSHTVEEFLNESFSYVSLDWREYVEIDERYMRPTEVSFLQADPAKAKRDLGWSPKVTFKDLVRIMVDAEMEAIGAVPVGEGKAVVDSYFDEWHSWHS
tara:strand:- start:2162 stop:3208 length:1047 start_codon:yes stop_codon:yes gene_type:complete